MLLIIAPGMAASGKCTYTNVSASDAKHIMEEEDVFLLDVRTPAEYSYSHIESATLIPLKNVPLHDPVSLPDDQLLPNRVKELPADKNTIIVVYCYTGKRGGIASQMIADAGYKRVYNIQEGSISGQGGLIEWVNDGYPVVIVIDSASWSDNYPHYS